MNEELEQAVARRLRGWEERHVVRRIWEIDHTVWSENPTEIADRLGWLVLPTTMDDHIEELEAFAGQVAGEGFQAVVLLGMGGSSLAPEVFRETFGAQRGMALHVLDSTVPGQIRAVEEQLDLERTLFVVASKSGGTIETRSHFEYFWAKRPVGSQFAIVTDPGSALDALGQERGVRAIFRNPPEIGGRYSALSYFGLVPAALLGVDLRRLLAGAAEMAKACGPSVPVAENPAAPLGALMVEAMLAGRDKLTLALPGAISSFGYWLEQLVAESTGKAGKGVVPVEGEPLGRPEVYGDDRLFVSYDHDSRLAALEAVGHPVMRLPFADPYGLGAEMFRWELATALAGEALGINPFDQPNVQEAKDSAGRILGGQPVDAATPPAGEVLAGVRAGDYIAITAYVARNVETESALQEARVRLRERYGVATTVGFGPRFLHSTGQLHKGGADNVVVLQVTDGDEGDLPVPGASYTFGQLRDAQALGDVAALKQHGRRVARLTLEELGRL